MYGYITTKEIEGIYASDNRLTVGQEYQRSCWISMPAQHAYRKNPSPSACATAVDRWAFK